MSQRHEGNLSPVLELLGKEPLLCCHTNPCNTQRLRNNFIHAAITYGHLMLHMLHITMLVFSICSLYLCFIMCIFHSHYYIAYGLTTAVTSVKTYSDIFTFCPAGNENVVHKQNIFHPVHSKNVFCLCHVWLLLYITVISFLLNTFRQCQLSSTCQALLTESHLWR